MGFDLSKGSPILSNRKFFHIAEEIRKNRKTIKFLRFV